MTSEVTQAALEPCPWCGTAEHLSFQWPGSMTADMPDRPCRVVCTHIDHDTVVGPTAYGKLAAIAAWNTRLTAQSGEGRSGAGEDAVDAERKAVLQNPRVNDAIQTALERGELTITPNGYLAALNARQSGEGERGQ